MKRRLVNLVLATIFIAGSPLIGKASESIVGEWLPLERTGDGLGVAKTYGKDGSVQASYGALSNYRYNLVGEKLILSSPPQEPSVFYIDLKGSSLILADISGNRQKLTRLSGDGKSGIVGKWSGDHHTGRNQIMHFTDGRNCYVSVPIVTEKGTYIVKGDNLTETFKGKKAERWKWEIHNDVLSMASQTKDRGERFRRKE